MLYQIFTSGYEGMVLFAVIVAYVLAIMIALSFHEFAHAFVAYKQGDDTAKLSGRMTLNPLAHLDPVGSVLLLIVGFGWAKPVQCNPLRFKKYKSGMVKVSIAGVIANLILAILFSFFFMLASKYADATTTFGNFLIFFCRYTCVISFCLAVFNLLPIPPLDGYSLLSALVKGDNPYMVFVQKYGLILMLIILLTPIFDIILNFLYSLVLMPLFQLWYLIL
ncbi:MAG: site-2 protease family protein [Christensenellales bacterium]